MFGDNVMTKVSQIYSEQPVSKEVALALYDFQEEITKAIQKAKQAGLPQGILVSMLDMQHVMQVQVMIDKARELNHGRPIPD